MVAHLPCRRSRGLVEPLFVEKVEELAES